MAERIFGSMGRTMSIVSADGTVSFKAVVQPLRYKNKIYLNGIVTELGYDSVNKYLVLCKPDIDLDAVDGLEKVLTLGEDKYFVDCSQKVYFRSEPYYCWAIVHKEGER